MIADTITLTENEQLALKAWVGSYEDFDFFSFRLIGERSGLEQGLVRRTVRNLARKGVAKFGSGLMTEDGDFRGSGYGLTAIGRDLMHHIYADEIEEAF